MSEPRDDPREVLALLNSLGFIGITAQQLKAFMKDLKIYRKIKECERQQHKEEIRNRILQKQRHMVKEIIDEQSRRRQNDENNADSTSSDSNESLEVRKTVATRKEREVLRSLRSNKENRNSRNLIAASSKERSKQENKEVVPTQHECRILTEVNKCKNEAAKAQSLNRAKQSIMVEIGDCRRPTSAPNGLKHARKPRSRSVSTDRTRSARSQSVPRSKSSTCSGPKSFIRSWKLQGAQKGLVGKSDPVALYQKYQEEWKRIAFPGEAKHVNVRWAVREKMLGNDPRPMPLQRQVKSASIFK